MRSRASRLTLEAMVGGGGAAPVARSPRPAAKDAGRVLAMRQKPVAKPKRPSVASPSAEDEIPMGETGTYGRF